MINLKSVRDVLKRLEDNSTAYGIGFATLALSQARIILKQLEEEMTDVIWDEIQRVLSKNTSLKEGAVEEIEQILAEGEIDKKVATALLQKLLEEGE